MPNSKGKPRRVSSIQIASEAARDAQEALKISAETRALVGQLMRQAANGPTLHVGKTPPVVPLWGERPLNKRERDAILALVSFKAEETGLAPRTVEAAVERVFGIQEPGFEQLKAWNFDDVIRFLTEYQVADANVEAAA